MLHLFSRNFINGSKLFVLTISPLLKCSLVFIIPLDGNNNKCIADIVLPLLKLSTSVFKKRCIRLCNCHHLVFESINDCIYNNVSLFFLIFWFVTLTTRAFVFPIVKNFMQILGFDYSVRAFTDNNSYRYNRGRVARKYEEKHVYKLHENIGCQILFFSLHVMPGGLFG